MKVFNVPSTIKRNKNKYLSDSLQHATDESPSSIVPAMLTTIDNPFNPFTQFRDWFDFDVSKNYNSCTYLARIANTSDDLSEVDNIIETNRAIDEIVAYNLSGMHAKVTRGGLESRPLPLATNPVSRNAPAGSKSELG